MAGFKRKPLENNDLIGFPMSLFKQYWLILTQKWVLLYFFRLFMLIIDFLRHFNMTWWGPCSFSLCIKLIQDFEYQIKHSSFRISGDMFHLVSLDWSSSRRKETRGFLHTRKQENSNNSRQNASNCDAKWLVDIKKDRHYKRKLLPNDI